MHSMGLLKGLSEVSLCDCIQDMTIINLLTTGCQLQHSGVHLQFQLLGGYS